MPCYGPDGPPNTRSDVAEREVNRLTNMLCGVLRLMTGEQIKMLHPETAKWWKGHLELDRLRANQEEARRQQKRAEKKALDKLTSEDRKVLGV